MANKFLPFVVEKSTPINIFSALLSRSKGMRPSLIASVFNLILKVGVVPIRKYIKTLDDMPTTQLYEELTSQFSDCRIDSGLLELYMSFAQFLAPDYKERVSDELHDLSADDVTIFFMVMLDHPMWDEYTSIPFPLLEQKREQILFNLPNYIVFSDTGIPTEFRDANHLQAFILYNTVLSSDPIKNPIRAVCKQQGDS